MITHNRVDMQMVARVATSKTASAAVTAAWLIDLGEPGGRDESNMVITCPALSAAVTLQVVGAGSRDGELSAVGAALTTTANADFEVRMRVPLDAPRFITLKVTNGTTAPSASVEAQLAVLV